MQNLSIKGVWTWLCSVKEGNQDTNWTYPKTSIPIESRGPREAWTSKVMWLIPSTNRNETHKVANICLIQTCWPLWMIPIQLFIQGTLLLRLWLQRRLFALFVPQQNYQLNFLQRHCKHPLSSAKLRWSVAQQVQEGVLIKPGFKVQRSRLSTLAQIPSVAANQGL